MTTPQPAPGPAGIVADAVTVLFVPADRPDRFARAAASTADVVVVDLEDAVAPAAKEQARHHIRAALAPAPPGSGASAADGGLRAVVRVNALDGPAGAADLDLVAAVVAEPGHGLLGVMVPKADAPEQVALVLDHLALAEGPPPAVVALVETARGVVGLTGLAAAPGLTRLAFGALDLALDVGADLDSPVAASARAQLVLVSRAAGLPAPLESPATELRDPERVLGSTRAARAVGFGGRLCIHPSQLEPVRQAFRPTPAEVAWARSVVRAGPSAASVGGEMVDRPVVERARRILDRAGEQPG